VVWSWGSAHWSHFLFWVSGPRLIFAFGGLDLELTFWFGGSGSWVDVLSWGLVLVFFSWCLASPGGLGQV
jgi:hypothetical protein